MGIPEMVATAIIVLVPAIACLIGISMLIDAGRAKGYKFDKTFLLWFVGIFATPIVLGLYIVALPDKRS